MAAILCQSISNLIKSTCSACGEICKLPCTLCSTVCGSCCDVTKKVCTSSFCFYVTVALGLNIPPIVFSLQSIAYAGGCQGAQWLLVNMILCLLHIVAAFYLTQKTDSWSDAMEVLCYDPWIAGYILVGIGFFFWLCTGVSWNVQGAMVNGNCPDNIASLASNSIYCGISFFTIGCFALCVSMCCLGVRNRQSRDHNVYGIAQKNGDNQYKAPFANAV